MLRSVGVALLVGPLVLGIACGSSDSQKPGGGGDGDAGEGADAGAGGEGGNAGEAGNGGTAGSSGTAGNAGSAQGGSDGGTAGTSNPGGEGGSGDAGAGATAGAGEGGGGAGGTVEVTLTVTTTADVHAISPLIYGVNPSEGVECGNQTARFTLCRLGGNPWSTYNWENNASNAGNDANLCSENNAALGASDVAGATVTAMVTEAGANGASAVVTIPMLDHVAADKTAGMPYPLCTGDVRNSTDYLNTRMKQNRPRKGAAFVDPPATDDAYVNQDEFVSFLETHAGNTNVLFVLDNQPELWGQTHIAVHPDPTSYQEVVARNADYAAMIRENWPEAEILGYGGYGWQAFINLQNSPNRPNAEFLDWYLASMEAESNSAGDRLIDYLDIHWYAETPDTPEDRVQAPRSLWESGYVEPSWIGDGYGAIRLIPWVMEKIDAYYPDTKLSISSYAYGGIDEISGAIAVADALGVFGREGVSLAAIEPQSGDNTFNVGAFAAFRNYDGNGSAFGDESVRATTSDNARVSVYASTDSTDADRVVIVAINRNAADQPVLLDIQDATSFTDADVFVLTDASPDMVAADPLTTSDANHFATTLPGYSISVIVPVP